VIDPSGYFPRLVRASAELLAGSVEHYTFISTISVFADFKTSGMDESAPVGKIADESIEQITGETYGPLKALCEQAAERAMPGRVLTIRPGLIVGPHDPTDRFTYWPVRVARGGEVLAPNRPGYLIQVIDARDLAEWTVRMVEAKHTGIFNATGPDYPLAMERLLRESKRVSGSDARFTWVSEEVLQAQGATPWTEVTLWMPEQGNEGLSTIDVRKAIAVGLSFRPLSDTIRDTLAWDAARPPETVRRNGITPEREQAWLRAWHDRTG
jgi:2'-hydroxyisoflavone reductase